MSLLDKLMFWKKDTVELDFDVNGCFTLPESDELAPGPIGDTLEEPGPIEDIDGRI